MDKNESEVAKTIKVGYFIDVLHSLFTFCNDLFRD
jgi:hypothetical protein